MEAKTKRENVAHLANIFLALSDKTRLKLLDLMRNGEVPVGFLAKSLGESQPKTSRHLAYLRNTGLVTTRRDGKWIYYALEKRLDEVSENIIAATLRSLSKSDEGYNGLPKAAGTLKRTSSLKKKPDTLPQAYMSRTGSYTEPTQVSEGDSDNILPQTYMYDDDSDDRDEEIEVFLL